jgi:hypothetical protein
MPKREPTVVGVSVWGFVNVRSVVNELAWREEQEHFPNIHDGPEDGSVRGIHSTYPGAGLD